MHQQTTFYQNSLRYWAEYYLENLTEFSRIAADDKTELFWKELYKMYDEGTLIVINLNGHTTDGKSTVALTIQNKMMVEKCKKEMSIKYICRNQQEYADWKRLYPDERNCFVLIDEYSDLATSGENATIEQKYLDELSNIHAQYFVNRITCSPKENPDKNAVIQLEVASRDKKKKTTQCYLYYILYREGVERQQIIGHVNFNVANTINATWYKEYRSRKFKRMEMLVKEGIANERDLDYADMIYDIIKRYEYIARFGRVSTAMVEEYIEQLSVKKRIPMTILGKRLMADKTKAIFELMKQQQKIHDTIIHLENQKNKGKLSLLEEKQLDHMASALKEYTQIIEESKAFLQKKLNIYKTYKKIE